jgi:formylglycine-generating enzyme required for sulfatase activity
MATRADRAAAMQSAPVAAPDSAHALAVSSEPRREPSRRRRVARITLLVLAVLGLLAGVRWWQVRLGPAAWLTLLLNPPEMVTILPGTFTMGSDEPLEGENLGPAHQVEIGAAFEIGKYEVTVAEYQVFARAMGLEPLDRPDRLPATGMTFAEATAYTQWLSRATFRSYRLPSESEWEYAARAGTTARYIRGDEATHLDEVGWYAKNARGRLYAVGQKAPNPWGVYDVLGNAAEWVEDRYHPSYTGGPTDGAPRRDGSPVRGRVIRGGSSLSREAEAWVAARMEYPTTARAVNLGFRLARDLD